MPKLPPRPLRDLARPIRSGAEEAKAKDPLTRSRKEQSAVEAERLTNDAIPFSIMTAIFAGGPAAGVPSLIDGGFVWDALGGIGGGVAGIFVLGLAIRAWYYARARAKQIEEIRVSVPGGYETLSRIEQVDVELRAVEDYLATGVRTDLPQGQWNDKSDALRKTPSVRPLIPSLDAAETQINLFNHGKVTADSVKKSVARAREEIRAAFPAVSDQAEE